MKLRRSVYSTKVEGIFITSAHLAYGQELLPELVAWRRHLHQHPELSFEEYETTAFIADYLTRWGVSFRRPGKTGLIAELKGNKPGPTIALRADIDALPIEEETGLPFSSQNKAIMHACGHDCHTTILLGVARRFADLKGDFPGTVRFMFQPAEEMTPGGALGLIEAGVLDGVKVAYGLHMRSTLDVGKAAIRSGPANANSDRFIANIFGKGGHAARPHQTVDAALIAAQTLVNLQTVVARNVDPLKSAVLTVGSIHAGSAFNVIPDKAELKGTVRTRDDETRDLMEAAVRRVVEKTADLAGGRAEVRYVRGYPVLINHERETAVIRAAAASVLGDDNVVDAQPGMGGEDFAYYLQKVPGAFLNLGAKEPGNDDVYSHHHPKVRFDERSLAYGVAIMTETALRELAAG